MSLLNLRTVSACLSAALCVVMTLLAPANASEPGFGAFIDSFPGYEGQSKCDPSDKPGVLAFRAIVLAREPGTGAGSISRDCSVGGQSEHKEGRAWDWGANASNPAQRAAAHRVIDWLQATDAFGNKAALARRFGIMYLIYERRIWFPEGGWRVYCVQKAVGCVAPGTKSDVRDPHTSHVHFSFTWDGALKKTSYWHPQDSMASAVAMSPGGGYWVAGRSGAVIANDAGYYGAAETKLDKPVAAIAATPSGTGYLMTTTRGKVLAFGDARFRGQVKDSKIRITDIASTPSGRGYWLVSEGGRVLPFGDADRFGGTRGATAVAVVAILPTPTGLGYSLVSGDGTVTAFGDATASARAPKVGGDGVVAASSSPLGVWMTTSDGKVVGTGGVPALPDLSGRSPDSPIIDIAASDTGEGYLLLMENGRVKAFGDSR